DRRPADGVGPRLARRLDAGAVVAVAGDGGERQQEHGRGAGSCAPHPAVGAGVLALRPGVHGTGLLRSRRGTRPVTWAGTAAGPGPRGPDILTEAAAGVHRTRPVPGVTGGPCGLRITRLRSASSGRGPSAPGRGNTRAERKYARRGRNRPRRAPLDGPAVFRAEATIPV